MQTRPPSAPQNAVPRRLKWLLWASLGVNLIVVGLIAGAALRGPFDGPPRDLRAAVAPYSAALDRDSRHAIGRAIREASGGLSARRALRDARRSEIDAALDLLRAEPFDADAFRAVLASQSARALARQAVAQDALADHLATLSAQDRAAYADRIEEGLHRALRRRH